MTWEQQDSITLTQQLHRTLESLQIPYYLGGGLAAAIWGEPRVTQDADLILSFSPEDRDRQIIVLIAELEHIGFKVIRLQACELLSNIEQPLNDDVKQVVDKDYCKNSE